MDLSKRVRVLHPEGIVMYIRGIYRFVHLFAMSKENLFTLISSSVPKDLGRYLTSTIVTTVSLVAVSNYCIELNERKRSDKFPSDVYGLIYYSRILCEKSDFILNHMIVREWNSSFSITVYFSSLYINLQDLITMQF